ncbi:MAG: hypothetical protein RLZZ621_572 [Gemmatimonadota bacterium]
MKRHVLWCIGLLLLAFARSAEAQACLGLSSFADTPVRLTGARLFPVDGTDADAVALGAGRSHGIFLSLGYARVRHGAADVFPDDDPTEQQTLFELGYQIPLGGGRVQLCPVGGAGLGKGPVINNTDYRRRFASAGLAIGIPLNLGFGIRLAPNASARWEYLRTTAEGLVDAGSSGVADVGLGLIIARRLVVQPTYSMPFATGTSEDPRLGVVVSIGSGWRPR